MINTPVLDTKTVPNRCRHWRGVAVGIEGIEQTDRRRNSGEKAAAEQWCRASCDCVRRFTPVRRRCSDKGPARFPAVGRWAAD